VKIHGQQKYLWRAVNQDGEMVDVYLQSRSDSAAAKRFFKRLIRNHSNEPSRAFTSTDTCSRKKNAPIQIDAASATFFWVLM
jgi:transposase-like protein